MSAHDRLQRSMLEGWLGPLDAFVDLTQRARRTGFGGPLHGQAFRGLIVEGVIAACEAKVVSDTVRHIIHLRALAISHRWGDAMDLMLRPVRKAVRIAA